MEHLTDNLQENRRLLDEKIGVGRSYDVISRDLIIGGIKGRMYVVDGYGDDATLERILSVLLSLKQEDVKDITTMEEMIARHITFGEVSAENKIRTILTGVFLGKTALVLEGFDHCALIDAKNFPGREVQEPNHGRVLRGSHDGFVEILLKNTSLIRRRIRDENLTLESHQVGENGRTDVVLAYMENKVDRQILDDVRKKLKKIRVNACAMSQESVAEAMTERQWLNPFPRVRYTERPDAAVACIMEGYVVLLVDNSAAAMLLPTYFFDFMEEANDFYFPPVIGVYFRYIRFAVFLMSLIVTPIWYLFAKSPELVPQGLEFLVLDDPGHVPLLAQLLLVEFAIDILKLASLNTPDVLSNSFSMIGALILGDFAVQAKWLVPEVLVYMAYVSIASFALPSFEMGYAFKYMRVLLLVLIALMDWGGFAVGMIVWLFLLFTTKPLAGKGYMYPLYPFDKKGLRTLLIRSPINRSNS